jgi:hypothetical protein
MIADSSFMFKSLNKSFHDFDWLSFLSRYTRILKFSDRLWIRVEDESFRMFNASFNWRMTFSFRTSFIALRIAMNRWVIVDDETFISIMREYASKTSNVNIKSSKFIESFNTLKVICKVEFESISNNFATIIAYTRRKDSWYRFIISIEWWVSIKTMLTSLAVELGFGQKFKPDPRVDVRPGWTDQSSQSDPRVDVRRVLSSLSETSYI